MTDAGTAGLARMMASFAKASATEFWARGTCAAVQRSKPAQGLTAGGPERISSASLTRHRPASCSTMSFESRSRWTSRAPSSARQRSARSIAGVLGARCWSGFQVIRDRRRSRDSADGDHGHPGNQRSYRAATKRSRTGIAAGRAVGPDDKSARPAGRRWRGRGLAIILGDGSRSGNNVPLRSASHDGAAHLGGSPA